MTSSDSPLLSEDELVLSLIATGLVILEKKVKNGNPPTLPYPTPLQIGLNKLSVKCLLKGKTPPQGVPDLLDWCRGPLIEFHLDLPEDAFGAADTLLDEQGTTEFCREWACSNPDVEAELTQQRIIIKALEICRKAKAPKSYVEFRRFAIENLVITQSDLIERCLTLYPEDLAGPLKEAYDEAPDAALKDDYFYCCPNCGNLLLHHVNQGWICPTPRFHKYTNTIQERCIKKNEGVFWLKRGLRQFTVAPGIAEIRLEEELKKLGKGIQVELWPEYDSYDLRIVFPDGEAWAIDVKDWISPYLLAKKVSAKTIPYYPEWKKFYFLFPDERSQENPNYLQMFNRNCTVIKKNVIIADFATSLIKQVKQKLSKIK